MKVLLLYFATLEILYMYKVKISKGIFFLSYNPLIQQRDYEK